MKIKDIKLLAGYKLFFLLKRKQNFCRAWFYTDLEQTSSYK